MNYPLYLEAERLSDLDSKDEVVLICTSEPTEGYVRVYTEEEMKDELNAYAVSFEWIADSEDLLAIKKYARQNAELIRTGCIS